MVTRSPARSSTGPEVDLSGDLHLVGDDVRERGLAEPGRPEQEDVVERFAAPLRRLDEDAQVVDDALLADVVGEAARAERDFDFAVVDRARSRTGSRDQACAP